MAEGGRGGRVRSFVAARSMPQRFGALGALVVLALAPFGGLSRADEAAAAPLRLQHPYDIGPFYLSFDRVVTLADLGAAVTPPRGDRLLAIEVTISNHTDRAEYQSLAFEAIGAVHTNAVPWPGDEDIKPHVYDTADGSLHSGGEWLNPGQTNQLVLVVPQRGGTPADFTMSLNGYVYETEDVTTLAEDRWVQQRFVAAGPVRVTDR